ncbi:DEAD/DEAH box helicase family protein [Microbacterium sp. NPDC079176]|uniref:DEAD/DEAH box helicase n=1 Tax=Microbacterium sp. NPDC079176 TaxID=3154768 RepID=UPI0034443F29
MTGNAGTDGGDESALPSAGGVPVARSSLYETDLSGFSLLRSPSTPSWRRPQLGALAAITSHWTLDPSERLLVSLPTGSGKTGVATALPHIARAHRALVVVPSRELRFQLATAFRDQPDLEKVGAVSSSYPRPVVTEVTGRRIDWEALASSDVVVALPNSISPQNMEPEWLPSADFFDLVIVDEAHHTPAATWRALLDYFTNARAVLLTATPRRADGRLLPGTHVYHFPLRAAIADNLFNPITPVILEIPAPLTETAKDTAIAERVVATMSEAEHATSVALIRAGSVLRATTLQTLYARLGLTAEIIVGTTSTTDRQSMLSRWNSGELRAVIAVDMLGEGIDVPRLRVVGYHDKHKSEPATIQFIGRLARTNPAYPQHSVLVTVHDEDVYPALTGALRSLYVEDADWAQILPTLIDDDIHREQADRAYLAAFEDAPFTFSLSAIRPLARASMYEVPVLNPWEPDFSDGVPAPLRPGERILGREIVYAGLNDLHTQLIVITAESDQPSWYAGTELRRDIFDLAVVSWIRSGDTRRPHLLFVNAQDDGLLNAIRDTLDPTGEVRNGNPASLQAAFDSVERVSVSSVGVRNTFAPLPGTPAYSTFAGSGIDRGLRDADTHSRSLGHAMAQVRVSSGATTTAGLAAEKAKYWETRYLGLREYEHFAIDLAGRYWSPRITDSGPLLPNVSKGIRTDTFGAQPLAAELNPGLFGASWALPDGRTIESLDIEPSPTDPQDAAHLSVRVFDPTEPTVTIWAGTQTIDGRFTTIRGDEILRRGTGHQATIPELFDADPPLVYFLDGTTISGPTTFRSPGAERSLPPIPFTPITWTGVDITKEVRPASGLISIHQWVEDRLTIPTAPGVSRWVFNNDGGGEIADHIVIERTTTGRIRLEMWHSKFSSSTTPAVRVTDMEVVTQQAAKSRRHVTDRGFWNRVARRLDGTERPPLRLIAGDLSDIRALCGLDPARTEESIADTPPLLEATIVIVQPGLSINDLEHRLAAPTVDISAGQVREFLTFVHNAVGGLATIEFYCSA